MQVLDLLLEQFHLTFSIGISFGILLKLRILLYVVGAALLQDLDLLFQVVIVF